MKRMDDAGVSELKPFLTPPPPSPPPFINPGATCTAPLPPASPLPELDPTSRLLHLSHRLLRHDSNNRTQTCEAAKQVQEWRPGSFGDLHRENASPPSARLLCCETFTDLHSPFTFIMPPPDYPPVWISPAKLWTTGRL
ncbi:unnamed protein product [Pleuronectes platessa]|uniref:Uncharacterized protein n=1 Tax=Pleuronectes platessa TaxID=8262 RepID=A0A9N7VTG8_PLEPL|nr:unnamed protein product [Pleuronectes platessa]